MGYDERQQPNSSGALAAVIGIGLVLAILAIIAVAAIGLFWVRARTQQSQAVARERVVAELHRAGAEAHLADAMAQLEQSRLKVTPGSRLNFVLEIDREGNLSVAGDVIGLDELKKRLAEFKDKSHNTFLLRIDTDPDCPARHIIAVLDMCDEVGDIDYQIASSESMDVKMTAIVASYEPAAEWDHFDDGTFSAYDVITLKVVTPERHAGTTFSFTVPPTEFSEDSAIRTTGTRLTFTVRESDIGATGLAWGAVGDPAIEQ
jgi:biopolymer transport protein ExbD